MLGLTWLGAALLGGMAPPDGKNCLGVAVETPKGRVALLWLDLTGPPDALERFTSEALLIGVLPTDINRTAGSLHMVFIGPRVHGKDVTALAVRMQKGEFGPLQDKPMIMDISTIAACSKD